MKLGFIILAHQDLHRVTELAMFLSKNDCPVGLHIDLNADPVAYDKLKKDLGSFDNIHFAKREKCGWGQFSIVKATLNAAEALFEHHDDLDRVFLASGSCLPARPLKQLKAFLARHPNVDFIESFSPSDAKWVKDGLDRERFTLFFPLSWRKHRYAFDRLVDIQRRFGIKRAVPQNIRPHMGSQWWCLTAKTLRNIVEDPKRAENDRYFAKTWIPDESYFQSLARNHMDHIRPQSLTFASFDAQGKPFLFYDDHLADLPKTDAFFIRKVWPGANKMYNSLLKKNRTNHPLSASDSIAFRKFFDDARGLSETGNKGRILQGRFPSAHVQGSGVSNRDFGVLVGMGHLFQDFSSWADKLKNVNIYGNIFKRGLSKFKSGSYITIGNLTADSRLRNYNPKGYLSNFLTSKADEQQLSFQLDVTDVQKILPHITADDHANFVIIRESWLMLLANSRENFKSKLAKAQVFQAREVKMLKAFETDGSARYTIFTLDDALKAPGLVLQTALKTSNPVVGSQPMALPVLRNTSKLDAFVRKLAKSGLDVSYKPKRKKKKSRAKNVVTEVSQVRPYVVK